MQCTRPLTAYQDGEGFISFNHNQKDNHRQLLLPCGQCADCRLERSRQWAVRIMHEAQLSAHNCFITLTYDDEHLPPAGNLDKKRFPKFMRSLRQSVKRTVNGARPSAYLTDAGAPIRFYMCGEYGERTQRPHYHACLFNIDFKDKIKFKTTEQGNALYISQALRQIWPLGNSLIGDLTFESAAYTARYIMKKITGNISKKHYEKLNIETGEITKINAEFNNMSRKPGIASRWLDKYITDVYPHDYVVTRGHKARPPRYYDQRWKQTNKQSFQDIQETRILKHNREESTDARLKVKEIVTAAKLRLLPRSIE